MTPFVAPRPLVPLVFGALLFGALFLGWRELLPHGGERLLRAPHTFGYCPAHRRFVAPPPVRVVTRTVYVPVPMPLDPQPRALPPAGSAARRRIERSVELISQQARIVPTIDARGVAGYRLYAIRPQGELLVARGLENGDAIVGLGDLPVVTPDALALALAAIDHGGGPPLHIIRRGQPMVLSWARNAPRKLASAPSSPR